MTAFDTAPPAPPARAALASPLAVGAVFAALLVVAVLPVWLWPIPRGNDIVNHWARLTLYRLAPDDPIAGLYRAHFGLVPNLGLDALYLALSAWASPQAVTQFAWMLAVALPALGALAIHSALYEKPSPTILLVPLLSYNIATSTGLLNYSLGIGLGLLALAYALSRPRFGLREILALNVLGGVLFFCHLIAWAAYALLLGLILVSVWPLSLRALARRAGLAVLAQAAPLVLVAFREAPPSTYSMGEQASIGFLQATTGSFAAPYGAVFLPLALAIALVLRLRVAPAARLALLGFALAAWAAPSAQGAATLIDARLKVYVWYFGLAVVSAEASDRLRAPLALVALALTAARVYAVAPVWERFQDQAAEVRAALTALPPGSRALVVEPSGCRDPRLPSLTALTPFAVIDRRAYVNTLFAQSGIQPAAPADVALDGSPNLPMDSRWLTPKGQAELPAWHTQAKWAAPYLDWRRHFTHILDAHGACASAVEATGLTRLGGGGGLDIYRID